MTRRRVLCGLLLSAVLACGVGTVWIANASKMTRGRFEQVKEGISREEVIRTVGALPRGTYDARFRSDSAWWRCDDAELHVTFNASETVYAMAILDVPPSQREPTLTERIRRWLGR